MELVRWQPFEGLSRLHSRSNDLFDEGSDGARTHVVRRPRHVSEAFEIDRPLAGTCLKEFAAELRGFNFNLSRFGFFRFWQVERQHTVLEFG